MRSIMLALALLSASGCATVLHGTRQRIAVESTPPGAQVYIDGQAMGDTPLHTTLDATEGHEILVRAEGHEDALVSLPTEAIPAYYVLNAIFTLGIGIWIDHSTGAIYGIDDSVHVDLAPREASAHTETPARTTSQLSSR